MRLKTKLMLAISGMVVAVVTILSSIYVTQLVKQRVDEAFENGEFVSLQVFHTVREVLETDLSNTKADISTPDKFSAAMQETLETDAGLNSLMQSIIGYSPTVSDISISDNTGKIMIHTDATMIGKQVPKRPTLRDVKNGSLWTKLRVVYGEPRVYDMELPMQRDGAPFATIRVGISTVFLKGSLEPKLNTALVLATIAIFTSLLFSVLVSNLALRPLERINRRLDELTRETDQRDPTIARTRRSDDYTAAQTKIESLGQQVKDVKEVFSALKENLDQMLSSLQDGVMLFTQENKAVLVSASMESFLHKSRGEMMGKSVHEVFADRPRLAGVIVDAIDHHRPIEQLEVLTDPADGRAAATRVQVSLDFIEEDGQKMGALLTFRDAESVHRIEDELEISRRLAAVGRLTSGVAHEVKNPINAIVVHLEVLRNKLKEIDPDARRHMDVIGTEIRRLDRVVQTLVDFTRPVDLRLADTDLRKLIDDIVSLSTPDAEKHNVHIRKRLSESPLPVKIDSDLVKQAILNIMINGMQAMKDGGDIEVSAFSLNDEAVIEIADHGPGIPKEIRDKIFNLYFTTKSGGSGIGLPMTYRVVQLHNGTIDFTSEEGKGTTFRLTFPLQESAKEAVASDGRDGALERA
jgi:PAS domain S-box-containing protein